MRTSEVNPAVKPRIHAARKQQLPDPARGRMRVAHSSGHEPLDRGERHRDGDAPGVGESPEGHERWSPLGIIDAANVDVMKCTPSSSPARAMWMPDRTSTTPNSISTGTNSTIGPALSFSGRPMG